MKGIRTLLLMFLIVVIAATPLTLAGVFAHYGGHAFFIVPAIVLNRHIPETDGAVSYERNPFPNFPEAIYLFYLSFPLGVVADGMLSYLSYKNAKLYRFSTWKRRVILLAIFLSFCIMNLEAALSNLFGQDFAFMWQGVGFPYDADWLHYFIGIVAYVVFPLFLGIKKGGFDLEKSLTVSAGTYAGSILANVFIFDYLQGMLTENFWWVFMAGLPIFITAVVALGWRRRPWIEIE